MASNATVTLPPGVFIPPPGTNFIAAIEPAVTYLMIGTTFGTLLVPLFICLFFFSTPTLRKSLVFCLNVVAVTFGLALTTLNAALEIHSMLSPLSPLQPSAYVGYAVITTIGPIFVDAILLLRLLAVFPYSRTPKMIWYPVIMFPACLKLGRVANIIFFTHIEGNVVLSSSAAGGVQVLAQYPSIKFEWFAQLIDNVFMSGMFLWRLRGHTDGAQLSATNKSMISKIRALFWLAAGNFVFPVILNITQLVIFFADNDFTLALYVQQANCYVTIIGVVFATVWSSGSTWFDETHKGPRAPVTSLGFGNHSNSAVVNLGHSSGSEHTKNGWGSYPSSMTRNDQRQDGAYAMKTIHTVSDAGGV